MNNYELLDLMRQTMVQVVIVVSPLLVIGVVVGLLSGAFQALTQVHDQSLSFAPKLIAVLLALGLGLPWMMERISQFATLLFTSGI